MEKQKITKDDCNKMVIKYADMHINELEKTCKENDVKFDNLTKFAEKLTAMHVAYIIINDIYDIV